MMDNLATLETEGPKGPSIAVLALPHTVAEWSKNSRETMRVTLSEYGGRKNLDVRTWYEADNGEMKPSPKGVTISIAHLPALASGIAAALAEARAAGLLQEGGDT